MARDTLYVDRDDAHPNRRCRQQTAVKYPWVSSFFHHLGPVHGRITYGHAFHAAPLLHSFSQPRGLGPRAAAGDGHQRHHLAVALEDLADVFAVFFIGPIISYILAAIFLKEAVTLPRSALLFLGFTGILLIARPGFGFSIGLACALFAGCSYGVFLTLSRLAAGQEEPKALLFSQLLIAAVLCTPMALIYWPEQLFASPSMLAVSGGASMLGNMFLILAYGRAPATRMAPFVYFQLVGALLLGWGVFGTLPDIWGLAGLALLMISGFGSAFLRR